MTRSDLTTIDATDLENPYEQREQPRASLVFYHRDGSDIAPFPPRTTLVVGRARPSDVAIRDVSLSRQHARFWYEDDVVWVEDMGSTNGTLLNGSKIERSAIKPGDEVKMGAVSATLHVLGPTESELTGLESHDHFIAALESEIVRARTFNRPFVLLMVRAAKHQRGHISHWYPHLREQLRPVDRTALYGPSSVLVLLPETSLAQGEAAAKRITASAPKGSPPLLCGLAVFPESATSVQELVAIARQAAQQARLRQPVQRAAAAQEPVEVSGSDEPVVVDPSMRDVFTTATRVAKAQIPVLIQGETGTGKEIVAQAIHQRSRRKGPLRCINCAAIPRQLIESALFGHERGSFTGATAQAKGLFEQAQRGTVLLDEIGELSAEAQAALLRVLETKRVSRIGGNKEIEVDVRILAATNRDLEQMCSEGGFRSDLLYRLNTMMIVLPPLRNRRSEILPLAQRFVEQANKANGCQVRAIDSVAQRLLQQYDWPGNVRELRNVMERAVVVAQDQTITGADLSERVRAISPEVATPNPEDSVNAVPADSNSLDIKGKLRQYEAGLLIQALREHDWNQTRTAEALGMPLRTLVHKIKAYNIQRSG